MLEGDRQPRRVSETFEGLEGVLERRARFRGFARSESICGFVASHDGLAKRDALLLKRDACDACRQSRVGEATLDEIDIGAKREGGSRYDAPGGRQADAFVDEFARTRIGTAFELDDGAVTRE